MRDRARLLHGERIASIDRREVQGRPDVIGRQPRRAAQGPLEDLRLLSERPPRLLLEHVLGVGPSEHRLFAVEIVD